MQQQQPPDKIDKYQILSVLGKGAMGVVYHAYDPVVKRDVAIKFLSSLDIEETELVSRFEREARLAGGLRHPNIVTIYDLGHFQERPYIVMEYIVGKDLEAIIRERQELTFEQKADIILQICKGLHAAHQKGIIHRDIKPANVRIQEDNTVKIMDFGIARMGASQLTRSGYIIGTLQYMSPEQISGEALDPRTDVFSSGVIAYELFTHLNPFTGGGAVDIMYRILNIRPQPVTDLPEEFATELNQIIMRALEKNKDLRYPGAKDMAQDLEEFLFYVKTIRLRPKMNTRERESRVPEGTSIIPPDQLPVAPQGVRDVPPTVGLDMGMQNLPTLNKTEPEKAPRTGIGANYSETAQQVLMRQQQQPSAWQEKKVYILGALLTLLLVGGYFGWVMMKPDDGILTAPLMITSTPPGAEIWVEGLMIGKTPLKFSQKKSMNIIFRMAGFKEKHVPVSEEAWPPEVTVKLDPAIEPPVSTARTIEVDTAPVGAEIVLDGKVVGGAPQKLTIDDDKPHELIVRQDGFQEDKRTIDRTSPESLQVTLQQQAATGFVRYLFSYPVGVYIDKKVVKGNPIELPPGSYKLQFRSRTPAYIRYSRNVEVASGETVTVGQPQMGAITIKANPSNCKISVDGEYLDEPPIVNLPMQEGSYMIQFSWPASGKKLSKPVNITPGQTVTVVGVPE